MNRGPFSATFPGFLSIFIGLSAAGALVLACDSAPEGDGREGSGGRPVGSGGRGSGGAAGAGGDDRGGAGGEGGGGRYLLGSVSIDADGNRISYAQVVSDLEGPFSNESGLEANGNAVFMTRGHHFFYGLAESPTWVKYDTRDGFEKVEQLSFLEYGITYMDFSNVIVDDETAVSVLTEAYVAVVWNPSTMTISGTVDLSHLYKEGFALEAFTVVTYGGLVYIPGRWANWSALQVEPIVHMTILDPRRLEIVGTAEDDRCGSGGRIVFDADGYGYVMADGRNQSLQSFAAAQGDSGPPNCLLRIAPGETDFEEDFFYEIPELTSGLDSMTELEAGAVDGGIGFTMMKYEERIDAGLDRTTFEHWSVPAYKMWRLVLGDQPVAEEVTGAHFSVVGFPGSALGGKLYSSESEDGSESTVFEIDPKTNTARRKFTMDGYFAALLPLD